MSSTFSLASAVSAWALKPRADSALSAFARSTRSAKKYYASIGRTFRFMPMCERLPPPCPIQFTLFAADTPASHSAAQESEWAMKMKGTSGQRCLELYRASGRDGLLPKMLLDILALVSTRLPHRWKLKASPSGRLLFQLRPLTHRTGAIGFGLWATPQARDHMPAHKPEYVMAKKAQGHGMRNLNDEVHMWPTPTRCENAGDLQKKAERRQKAKEKWGSRSGNGFGYSLAEAVQLWPTPRAADGPKGGNGPSSRDLSLTQAVKIWPTPVATMHKGSSQASLTRRNGQDRSNDRLDHAVFKTNGGQLNPAWVEWLMGFPSGWTDLNALATPLCPPSPMPSDGPFCSSKTNADPE
jgi:hypothetical protein